MLPLICWLACGLPMKLVEIRDELDFGACYSVNHPGVFKDENKMSADPLTYKKVCVTAFLTSQKRRTTAQISAMSG